MRVLIAGNKSSSFFLGKALEAGNQWYFFSHAKHSRVTPNGYWSSVCADETVSSGGGSVGLKKTLVFSTGEPSEGTETNWIMHEYHLLDGIRKGVSSSTSSTNNSSKKLHDPNTVRATCRHMFALLHLALLYLYIIHIHPNKGNKMLA